MQPDAAPSSGQAGAATLSDGSKAVSYGSVEGLVTAKGGPPASEKEVEEELVEEETVPDWEARGTVMGLIIDVGSVSAHRIVVLVGLMLGLNELAKNFIHCSREKTPLIETLSEEVFCHYTKAYVFCFPAIATGVLLLLIGRDLLQKRLYYGLLKAGAALSFTENVAYKDGFFLAMVINFLHCVAFYVFTLIILDRGGEKVIDHPEIKVQEFTTTPALLFASMGQNYTHPAMQNYTHPAMVAGSHITTESGVDYDTVKVLVLHFMPSVLIIVFIFLAYDITISLVPLSEYLNAFEAEGGNNPLRDLCTFKDSIAVNLLAKKAEMIATTDGDLPRLYEIVVEKYHRHRAELTKAPAFRSKSNKLFLPGEESPRSEADSPRWGKSMENLSSIGLAKSLWPADLLMRRDLRGDIVQNFRLFWMIFAIIAFLWLAQLQGFLIWVLVKEAQLLMKFELEQIIPLAIVLMHMVAVGIIMHVYYVTVRPLWQTSSLTATLPDAK